MFKKILSGILFLLILYPVFTGKPGNSSTANRIYITTADKGILLSENDGRSWSSLNKGLPDKFIPVKIYQNAGTFYLTTFSSGLFKLEEKKGIWENISSPDFKRRSIYYKEPGYRKISAFAVDPENSANICAATKHTIYRSADGGTTWEKIPMNGLNKIYYITALAISGSRIYAGTSFKSIYESAGGSFKLSGTGLPEEPYTDKAKYTEQCASLFCSKTDLFAGFYFGGGIYSRKNNLKKFDIIYSSKEKKMDSVIYDIRLHNSKLFFSDGFTVYMRDELKTVPVEKYNALLEKISGRGDVISAVISNIAGTYPPVSVKFPDPDKKKKNIKASGRNALYLSIPVISKNINKYLEIAKKTEINSFVIDMKDDFGNIYFQATEKTATEIKAQKKLPNLEQIIKKVKENNIYLIARIVVFKDMKLFSGYKGKYSIKNRNSGKPWTGVPTEFWVDPYSEFVHNYNIALAKDLEKLGFDEIQFDYIRFPSDGPIQFCNFSYKNDKETYKSEILIDFLRRAKEALNIPVSIDIYGFNSWYNGGNWIGQDMEELSYIVDAICPMVYPSHFGNRFYRYIDRKIRPYKIIKDGGVRGTQIADKSVSIRPYLQAFNLMSPTWGPEYIRFQINGSKESGCSGYTLWNANGDYTVSLTALKKE